MRINSNNYILKRMTEKKDDDRDAILKELH